MKKNYYGIAVVSVFGIIALVVIASILYTTFTTPKADYQGFSSAMQQYISSNKDIAQIERLERDMFRVTVQNTWHISSEYEKTLFCKNVHDSVYVLASQYKLIYKDSDNVYLTFYDKNGMKVAEQDMFDFKILQ